MPTTPLILVLFICLARCTGAEDQGGGGKRGGARQVCYKGLECFSMDPTWINILRPLPDPVAPDEIDPKFRFFTRESRKGQVVRIWPQLKPPLKRTRFNPARPLTVILIHGFASNSKVSWMKIIKDLYLMKVDANVILVDWENGSSRSNYFQVASNARVVGSMLAMLFREMQRVGQDFKKVHIIGHSLGAHISSYAANRIGEGIKPSRITGLDPAQPGFEGQPPAVRLSPDDADFVDVIHTDARPFIPFLGLGIMQPVGHVDFYLNGGSGQPHCVTDSIPRISSLQELVYMPVETLRKYFTCSHMRAYEVFMWAMVNNANCSIWGRKMLQGETFLKITSLGFLSLADPVIESMTQCSMNTCTVLGLETPSLPARGTFSVSTDYKPPFCLKMQDHVPTKMRSRLAAGLTGLYNTTIGAVSHIQSTIHSGLKYIIPNISFSLSWTTSTNT